MSSSIVNRLLNMKFAISSILLCLIISECLQLNACKIVSGASRNALRRICFKRYDDIEGDDECRFERISPAWYFDPDSGSCESYEVCAPEHLVYRTKARCETQCAELYEVSRISQALIQHNKKYYLQLDRSLTSNVLEDSSIWGKLKLLFIRILTNKQ